MLKKVLLLILCLSLFSGCHSNENELTVRDAFGHHYYKELYYVALLNKTMPDTLEAEMNAAPEVVIEEDMFIFQNYTLTNIEYVEDEFNDEEKQLYFKKKYKIIENGGDSYFRVYLTYKNVYVGVYYNTQSLRYIVKVK